MEDRWTGGRDLRPWLLRPSGGPGCFGRGQRENEDHKDEWATTTATYQSHLGQAGQSLRFSGFRTLEQNASPTRSTEGV